MRRVLPLLLSVLVALPALASETYHDSANGWRVTLPKGWNQVDQAPVKALDEEIARRAGKQKTFRYLAGFSPRSTDALVYPYVLAQFTPAPMHKASLEDVEKMLNAKTMGEAKKQVEKSFEELKSLDYGVPQFDRATRRLYIRISMQGPDGVKIKGLCIGFPTKRGLVQLNFYAEEAAFDDQVKAFERMVDTFRVDAGSVWEPREPSSSIPAGVIGGIIGGLAAGIYIATKRKA